MNQTDKYWENKLRKAQLKSLLAPTLVYNSSKLPPAKASAVRSAQRELAEQLGHRQARKVRRALKAARSAT